MTFKRLIIFFSVKQYIKEQEKKYSKSYGIKFWIPELFHKMYWILSENGILALFLVFLHLSKSHNSNVMAHLYFVFTLLIHIFISCKVPIKIKNKNFEHNFFEYVIFHSDLRKSEKLVQIRSKSAKKDNFVKLF